MTCHHRSPATALAAVALLLTASGCGSSEPAATDATMDLPESQSTTSPASTRATTATTDVSMPSDDGDDVIEALVLSTTEVPAQSIGLTAWGDALWTAGDGGSVVRITPDSTGDPTVDEVTVDGIEAALRPTFTDDGSWWAETGGTMVVPIDPDSLTIGTPAEVGEPVGAVVVGPDGRLWIEATQPPAGLRPFDPATGTAGDVVVLADTDEVVGTATADGSLWAPVFGANEILRLDPDLDTVDTVATGVGPATVRAVDHALWWTNRIDGTVERLDIASGETTTVDLNQPTSVDSPSPVVTGTDSVWVIAAAIDDRTGIVFRIDATTGEMIAARALPGGRSVDELGGFAVLDDRLFVLVSTTGELVELDGDDFTAVPDPDRPTPTTEPMSDDERAIRDAVATLFSSSTPPAEALVVLENSDQLGDAYGQFRQFFTDNFGDQDVAAEVFGVRIDGDTAEVDYVVTVSGGPIVDNQTASLVRSDDGWHLAQESFCDLVALGQIPCP